VGSAPLRSAPDAVGSTPLVPHDSALQRQGKVFGIREKTAPVRAALEALVEREAARRLARLGGSEPDLAPIPRRRIKRG
jgi:hypothetical protein